MPGPPGPRGPKVSCAPVQAVQAKSHCNAKRPATAHATAKKRAYRQRLREGVIIVGVPVSNEMVDYLMWLNALPEHESESRPAIGRAMAELIEDAMRNDEEFA